MLNKIEATTCNVKTCLELLDTESGLAYNSYGCTAHAPAGEIGDGVC